MRLNDIEAMLAEFCHSFMPEMPFMFIMVMSDGGLRPYVKRFTSAKDKELFFSLLTTMVGLYDPVAYGACTECWVTRLAKGESLDDYADDPDREDGVMIICGNADYSIHKNYRLSSDGKVGPVLDGEFTVARSVISDIFTRGKALSLRAKAERLTMSEKAEIEKRMMDTLGYDMSTFSVS